MNLKLGNWLADLLEEKPLKSLFLDFVFEKVKINFFSFKLSLQFLPYMNNPSKAKKYFSHCAFIIRTIKRLSMTAPGQQKPICEAIDATQLSF